MRSRFVVPRVASVELGYFGHVFNRPIDPNIPGRTPEEWAAYRARVEVAARQAE